MTLTLVENQFEAFFQAPFNAYGRNSLYVSPLKSDLKRFVDTRQNPLFENTDDIALFAVLEDGNPVGRICAHVHRASNKHYQLNDAYFGYFDCVDDPKVSALLLNAAEAWAKTRGYTTLIGNFNLTAMQQIGVVTGEFDAMPFTDLVYNPSHIPRLLEAAGYRAEFPMTTFSLDLQNTTPPVMGEKQQHIPADPDFDFLPITRRNIKTRMEQARKILNASFSRNPMFVPVTAEEFHFQAKDMAWIIDPRISAMLSFKGEPIATILCVPDMNPFLSRTR
nr:GNAT family N-acetyltransferase [Gammaproteobacteria bacterium]